MPKVIIDVGPCPCDAEGRCELYEYCKANYTDCVSFRGYVGDRPQIGEGPVKNVGGSGKGYRFILDRGMRLRKMRQSKGE